MGIRCAVSVVLVLEQWQGVKYLQGLIPVLPCVVLGSGGSILPAVTAEVTCWKVSKLRLQLHLSGAVREV